MADPATIDLSLWISGAGVVVALCALGLTIWQAHIARKHNKLSVRPHLCTWRNSDDNKGSFQVLLMNNGLGPAFIESFDVYLDGELIPGNYEEPIRELLRRLFPDEKYTSHQAFVGKHHAMPANSKLEIVRFAFDDPSPKHLEQVRKGFERADLVVKYQSAYEEKFCLKTAEEKSNIGLGSDQ